MMNLKPWQLYLCVFLLISVINYLLRMIGGKEWQDGNLLVNVVCNGLLTAGFIAGDRIRRKNKRTKTKVDELLKD